VLPATYFSNVLDQVLFPALATVQDDEERLQLGYRYGMSAVTLVILPLSTVAIALAPELVAVILGPNWTDVVVPFRILAVGMLFRTAARINSSIARATGAIYRRAWREGVYAACILGGALIGQRWGIAGVSLAVLGSLTIHFGLMTEFSMSLVSLRLRPLLALLWPGALLSAVSAAIVLPLGTLLRQQGLSPLVLLLTVGFALVAILGFMLWRWPRTMLGRDGVRIVSLLKAFVGRKWKKADALRRRRKHGLLQPEGEQ
jgi:PST family polysaccharide transporter